jgi:hypothetical protein
MLIWGSAGVTKDLGVVDQQRCATCETSRPFRLTLNYRYGHIWYLFKWVKEKQYSVACEVCQRGWNVEAKKVEPTLKTPPIPFAHRYGWAFLLGLVALLGGWGAVQAQMKESEDYTFIAAPKVGDLYVADLATLMKEPQARHMWGVLRARAVNGDAVEVEVSEGYYDRATGARKDVSGKKTAAGDYFDKERVLTISVARLKEMRQQRSIDEVVRP